MPYPNPLFVIGMFWKGIQKNKNIVVNKNWTKLISDSTAKLCKRTGVCDMRLCSFAGARSVSEWDEKWHSCRYFSSQHKKVRACSQSICMHSDSLWWIIAYYCIWFDENQRRWYREASGTHIPYILESNPHPFYSFRGLKNQMRIRIECGLDSRSRAGFWENDRAGVLTFFRLKSWQKLGAD
jgi:hypothetical protein